MSTSFTFFIFSALGIGSMLAGLLARFFVQRQPRWQLFYWAAAICIALATTLLIIPFAFTKWLGNTLNAELLPYQLVGADDTVITSLNTSRHVTIFAFWATWCAPCHAELNILQTMRDTGTFPIGTEVIAVNTEGLSPVEADRFLRKHQIYLSNRVIGTAPSIMGTGTFPFKPAVLPSLYITDARGRLRYIHTGYDSLEPLETTLQSEVRRIGNLK